MTIILCPPKQIVAGKQVNHLLKKQRVSMGSANRYVYDNILYFIHIFLDFFVNNRNIRGVPFFHFY